MDRAPARTRNARSSPNCRCEYFRARFALLFFKAHGARARSRNPLHYRHSSGLTCFSTSFRVRTFPAAHPSPRLVYAGGEGCVLFTIVLALVSPVYLPVPISQRVIYRVHNVYGIRGRQYVGLKIFRDCHNNLGSRRGSARVFALGSDRPIARVKHRRRPFRRDRMYITGLFLTMCIRVHASHIAARRQAQPRKFAGRPRTCDTCARASSRRPRVANQRKYDRARRGCTHQSKQRNTHHFDDNNFNVSG